MNCRATTVGITLAAVGLVAAVSGYALFLAPVFLIPGIIWLHAGCNRDRISGVRRNAPIAVLTLSYVALVPAIVAAGVVGFAFVQKSQPITEQGSVTGALSTSHLGAAAATQPGKTTNPSLGKGHLDPATSESHIERYRFWGGSSSSPSKQDMIFTREFAELVQRWGRETGPAFVDLLDTSVDGPTWILRHKTRLIECGVVVVAMLRLSDHVSDPGLRDTFTRLAQAHSMMHKGYLGLLSAIGNEDEEAQATALKTLEAAGAQKREITNEIMARRFKERTPEENARYIEDQTDRLLKNVQRP